MDSLVHGRVTCFLTFPTLSKRSLKNNVWNPKHPLQGLGAAVWSSGFPKDGRPDCLMCPESGWWLRGQHSLLSCFPLTFLLMFAHQLHCCPTCNEFPGVKLPFLLFVHTLVIRLLREIPRH